MSSAVGMELEAMPVGTSVENEDLREVATGLSHVLADTFTLYLKTHSYHWNVTGPMFHTFHAMFEEQYKELWMAGDELAERIRTLGFAAPGSYSEFSKLAYVREADGVPTTAREMIKDLLAGHVTATRTARWALSLARSAVDAPTEDLLTRRLTAHEKAAWMLSSILAEE